jgi:hypothetical protein
VAGIPPPHPEMKILILLVLAQIILILAFRALQNHNSRF